jgi:hypothetical protein
MHDHAASAVLGPLLCIMEQLFVDIFKTMIDYWMSQETFGDIVTFLAALELAVQAALMIVLKNGTTATVQDYDDGE